MQFRLTTATKKIAKLRNRLRCVQGGTSASKTVSILIYLIQLCQTDDSPDKTVSASKWRTESLKAVGNGIVGQVAVEIMKAIKEADV